MCAIIGAVIRFPTHSDFINLTNVFHESKIRGMHATGLAFIKNGRVEIQKLPVSADKFPFDFRSYVNEDGNLYLIGHCRYSTSDLEFNQPIGDHTSAIVHNGVITQELPENWERIYGYKTETKNDSELVWHSPNALKEFAHMSMAVCELSAKDKQLISYRNGKRPLYLTTLTNGSIITSTEDIPKRAGINFPTMQIPQNTVIKFDENMVMMVERFDIEGKDLQNYENHSN